MSGTELEMKAGLAGSSPAQVAFAACRQLTSRHLSLQNYPDGPDKVAGFVDYHLIELLQWDQHLHSPLLFGAPGTLRRLSGGLHIHSAMAHGQSCAQVWR